MKIFLVKSLFFKLEETCNMFSPLHFLQIAITIGILVGAFFLFRNKKSWETPLFCILAILSVLFMIAMLVWSIINNVFNPEWYAPFHICNLFAIIFPLMALFKNKIRHFLYDYTFYFGILGCLFAIIMPATTQLYFEPFHFISTMVWLYHILIGIAGVYLMSSKVYSPKISTLWRMLAILIPLVISAFIFNFFWDTNFCFMNPTKLYFPLNVFADYFGQYFVYVILAVIVGISLLLMSFSIVFMKLKNVFVGKIIKESKFFIYLKQQDIIGKVINSNLVKQMLKNEKIKQYFEHTKILVNDMNFAKCYNAISNELKNLTIEQLGDIKYMIELLNKSEIIKTLFKQIKFTKIKLIYKNIKSIPLNDFIQVLKQNLIKSEPVLTV